MVDIHCHVLPGVDDGAIDPEMSEAMLREAFDSGIEAIIATPHIDYRFGRDYFNHISKVFPETQKIAAGIGIELKLGAEIFHHEDNLKMIEKYPQFHLGDKEKYMLIETGFVDKPFGFKEAIFEIMSSGKKVILAHPERYRWLSEDRDVLDYLHHTGVLFQIDAGSITGVFSKRAQVFAWKLIEGGLVHSVGSDAHNLTGRSYLELSRAKSAVAEKLGESIAKTLFVDNNRAIMDGTDNIKIIPAMPKSKSILEIVSDFLINR